MDLSNVTLEALVPAEGGQWTTIAGAGEADGTFRIPGVPDAPYVLRVVFPNGVPRHIYTSARDIDLGTERAGRVDAVVPMISPTNVVSDLTNLAPWQGFDDIEWFVPNTNAWTTLLYAAIPPENPPAAGATTVNALTLDWSGAYGSALIDNAKGDVLTLFQLSQQTGPDNLIYNTVTRFASFDDIAQVDGGDVTASGALADVPQDQSASLDLRPTAFASHIAAMHPSAADLGFSAYIITLPGAGMYGAFGNSADLFVLQLGDGAPDVDLGPVAYGNPYPAAWGSLLIASNAVRKSYTVPGANTPANVVGSIFAAGDVASLTAGPIQPVVSPVQDLQVNGMSALDDLSGVTETPTLSWTAPELGSDVSYVIRVETLSNVNGAGRATVAASLYTKDTQVVLPPGILGAGSSYFVRIRAIVTPIDITAHPFRNTAAFAVADAFSNVFTP
jgi:hypothetical protein